MTSAELHSLRLLALQGQQGLTNVEDAITTPLVLDRIRHMCVRSLNDTAKAVDYAQLGALIVGQVEDYIDTQSIDGEARAMDTDLRRSA